MDPGTNALISIYINMQSYSFLPFFQTPFNIQIKARRCQLGEAYTSDKRCVQCSPLEYSFAAPQKETPCKVCPKEAQCYGRNLMSPAPGYWRSSNESETFLACFNPGACLGGNSSQPSGQCADGYQGILCANCEAGFRKTGTYQCSSCPSSAGLAIGFIVQVVVCVLIIVIFVKTAFYCSDKQKAQHSVYLRIITDHIQIMAIIFTIDFKWNKELSAIQYGQAYVSQLVDYMFTLECFWQNMGISDISDKAFVGKLIFFAVLPFTLLAIVIGVWLVFAAIRKSKHQIKEKIMSTMLIILFIINPTITQVLLQTFNCIEIEGVMRLQADLNTVCFQGQHMILILVLAGPGILIWGLGIPIVFLALLLKNKKTIMQIEHVLSLSKADQFQITQAKIKYGFLFIGFKTKSFFWEIVLMYKKILLIMTIVLLSVVSSDTQVLVALMLIIFMLIISVRFEPFSSQKINRMELYSVQVQTLTLYVGMFFVTGAHYTYMENKGAQYFFLIVVILANFGFLVYWMNAVRIEILMLALQKSRRLFKYLSCNLVNAEKFQRAYAIDADIADQYLEKQPESSANSGRNSESDTGRKSKDLADDFTNILQKQKSPDGSESPSASASSDSEDPKRKRRKNDESAEVDSEGTAKDRVGSVNHEDVRLDFPMRMMRRIVAREDSNYNSDRSGLMRRIQHGPKESQQSFRKVYPENKNNLQI